MRSTLGDRARPRERSRRSGSTSLGGDTRIYDAAKNVLDIVRAHYASIARDLPARQYVHFGDVAWDCEELVVAVSPREFQGTPANEVTFPMQVEQPRSAELSIWLVRCVPNLDNQANAPDPDPLDASAKEMLIDFWELPQGIYVAGRHRALTGSICELSRLVQTQAVGPEGDFSAVLVEIEITL